jgi:FixJ family two-component response regulator
MTMPVTGGAGLLTAISASSDLRRIPVIILSFLPEAAVRAREGAAAILGKPYIAEEVLDDIARVPGGVN